MRIPADLTDPDIVLADCKRLLKHAYGVRGIDDAERLEWLMRNVSGAELRRLGIETSAGCTRELIDAARTRGVKSPAVMPTTPKHCRYLIQTCTHGCQGDECAYVARGVGEADSKTGGAEG